MSTRSVTFTLSLLLLASSCATTGSGETSSADAGRVERPSDEDVSTFRVPQEEVPAAVRAIETQIDRRAAILADEIRIEVSKNYEWDVALTGDAVAPHKPARNGLESEASGGARATFRNLDLRATKRIVFWRSGLDVAPFIRVTARGNVCHVASDETGERVVQRRADVCAIRNAALYFDDEILREAATPASFDGR